MGKENSPVLTLQPKKESWSLYRQTRARAEKISY